jgi:exodeoxyribonuclease-3
MALMRIVTLNVNGIRSAARKGLFPWLARQRADVICLQEIRAHHEHLSDPQFQIKGFEAHYYPAVRPGYAGTAVYTRLAPSKVIRGIGVPEFDNEGRYLELQWKDLSVISLYLPSGSSGPERQASKFRFLEAFLPHLKKLHKSGRQHVLCGDWNIAHKQIDLKNWRSNQKNSGFLPEERAWLDHLFDEVGFIDAFRTLKPKAEEYTWWSNRGNAWANNVGWRIDYQILSPGLQSTPHKARIYRDQRFSDHAPLLMDYKF